MAVAARIRANGGRGLPIASDLTNRGSMAAFADAAPG